jgi:hypothetical protein
MANGPKTPTQIFAEYTQNTAEDISNYVDNLKKRRESVGIVTMEQKEPPTVADVLKSYQDKNKLAILQEEEAERVKYGMTPLEYARMKSGIQRGRSSSATALSAQFKKERQKIEDEEAVRLQEEKFSEDEKGGKGYLPSLIRNQFPKGEMTYTNASDINFVFDSDDAPDRTKVDAYFTFEDIDYMLDQGEFEKAGITDESVIEALNIDMDTGIPNVETADQKLKVQELIFNFLNTSHGSGMRNALKMNYKEKAQPNFIVLPSSLSDMNLSNIRFNDAIRDSTEPR